MLKMVIELKEEIVQDKEQMTLFEKLDANNRFETIMNRFIDKMTKDAVLSKYYRNNKMKHCISNKIVLFFAYSDGNKMNPDDMTSLKEYHKNINLTVEDFERSIFLLKESLYENSIDPILVEETLNYYKTMRRDLVASESFPNSQPLPPDLNLKILDKLPDGHPSVTEDMKKLSGCPFHKMIQTKQEGEKKESDKIISSFKLESNSNHNKQSSNLVSIQKEVEKINKQIEEETLKMEKEAR